MEAFAELHDLPAADVVYTTQPDSPNAKVLPLLASWDAVPEGAAQDHQP